MCSFKQQLIQELAQLDQLESQLQSAIERWEDQTLGPRLDICKDVLKQISDNIQTGGDIASKSGPHSMGVWVNMAGAVYFARIISEKIIKEIDHDED